ncbi:hypothetical protein BD833_1174 [Blastococcus xanthinilyticus]|uniref:Uncharacterized protein n=1 Tax=Blastococcus xanthinilyticus TaxID=1564164 RepID=A0A5S5CMC9_9ACTN|nr:hypothetical protein BD833_1174 [Blastococcus xanthinilyticus]
MRPNSWAAHTDPSGAQNTPTPSRSHPGFSTFARWPSDRIQPTWATPAGTGPEAVKMFSPSPRKPDSASRESTSRTSWCSSTPRSAMAALQSRATPASSSFQATGSRSRARRSSLTRSKISRAIRSSGAAASPAAGGDWGAGAVPDADEGDATTQPLVERTAATSAPSSGAVRRAMPLRYPLRAGGPLYRTARWGRRT